MPLTFPDNPTAYQVYNDPTGVVWEYDGVAWNTIRGTQTRTFSGVKVSLSVTNNLTSTPTPLDYDVENFDVGDYFDFYDAAKITIRVTGYYRIAGTMYTGSLGTGSSYKFTLRVNGSVNYTTQTCAANQSANYDTTAFFNAGDYLELLVSEDTATGTLLSGSYVELHRLGAAPGVAPSNADIFSGARVLLGLDFNTTSTLTSIVWGSADHDVNSDVFGNTYWNNSTRLTIRTAGYYQIKSYLTMAGIGSVDSYTVRLRKNNTTNITSTTLGPNDNAVIDEIYFFSANDYIELQASNSGSVGGVLAGSFLEIIRAGI